MQRYWALYDDRTGEDAIVFSGWSEREVLDYYIDNYLKPSWETDLQLCREFNVETPDDLKKDEFNQEVYDSMSNGERVLSGKIDLGIHLSK